MDFLITVATVAMIVFGWVGWAIGRKDQPIAWSFWGIGALIVTCVVAPEAMAGFPASNPVALACCILLGIPGLLGWCIGALCARFRRNPGERPTSG